MNAYRTLSTPGEGEITEKRSRFLACAAPVADEAAALDFLAQRRRTAHDARHHVYAYSLRDGQLRRYSDDGEPQGTGGLPVLELLAHESLVDCVVVVTRWFGGTLLGTGGLVRAYSSAAKLAIAAGAPAWQRPCAAFTLRCAYTQHSRIAAAAAGSTAVVEHTAYAEDVTLSGYIAAPAFDALVHAITEESAGTVTVTRGDTVYKAAEPG